MDYLYKYISEKLLKFAVVPHAGTWIEIYVYCYIDCMLLVVPHAGTWIEIIVGLLNWDENIVVPHAGTWIEIGMQRRSIESVRSFPTRERGLKYRHYAARSDASTVVPHAGTWIEIMHD